MDLKEAHEFCKTSWETTHLSNEYYYKPGDIEAYAADLKAAKDSRFNDPQREKDYLGGIGVIPTDTKWVDPITKKEKSRPLFFDIRTEGKNWRVCEIGSSFGGWAGYMCHYIKEYIGLDVVKNIVEIGNKALKIADIHNAKLIAVSDCSMNAVDDSSVDFVFSSAVFIHLPACLTQEYLVNSHRKLRQGGKFIFQFNMGTESDHNVEGMVNQFSETEYQTMMKNASLQSSQVFDFSFGVDDKWSRWSYGVKK